MRLPQMFTLFFCLLLTTAPAQNSLVRSGVKACRTGDYVHAIEQLSQALEHKGRITSRQLSKAYYYRAHARLRLLCQLGEVAAAKEPSVYAGTHLTAFDDLREAALTDQGKYAARIREDRSLLFDLLLEESLRRLNYGRQENIPAQRSEQAYRSARRFLQAAARIDDTHYLLQDLIGQVELGLGDYEKALSQFRQAIQAFQRRPPAKPDLLFGYTFYRKALIHYYYRYLNAEPGVKPGKYDIDQALESVQQGLTVLASEYGRAAEVGQLSVPEKGYLQSLYQEVQQDLRNLQLDLYLQAPDRYNEALKVFAAAVEEEPRQYLYYIAYGQLLELSSREKAVGIYESAAALAPYRPEAYYNLGAMYLNEASLLISQAKKEERIKRYSELMKEARELLRQARPFFEKAHRGDPDDLTVLNALLKICVVLDDAESYQVYHATKVELLNR